MSTDTNYKANNENKRIQRIQGFSEEGGVCFKNIINKNDLKIQQIIKIYFWKSFMHSENKDHWQIIKFSRLPVKNCIHIFKNKRKWEYKMDKF